MKKVTVKQLAKMLMEEKTVLANHPGGEEGTEGYEKDVLSRSWGDDEEADPKLDFVDEARWADLAGIQEQGREMDEPRDGDEVEYDRGYQDGFDSAPPASDATADYDIGYEDGEGDATLPELNEQARPGPGSATGDTVSDDVYRQALDLFGPSAIIDEENGELYIDTGLVDTDVEALYNDWITIWPDAMHEEGGLVYTGIST